MKIAIFFIFVTSLAFGQPTYVSDTSVVSSSSSAMTVITVTKPVSIQAGDFLLAMFTVTGTKTLIITPPSGWTLIDKNVSSIFFNMGFAYKKVATASEPASYSWTGNGFTNGYVGGIIAYRGVLDVDSWAWWGPTQVNITTHGANDLVVYFLTADWPETISGPTPSTVRWNITGNDNTGALGDVIQAVAGTTTPVSITLGPPGSNAGAPSLTIALSPGTPCTVDSNGWCLTGLSSVQDNLLGPLIPYGTNPWIYGDLMEKAVIDNMAPAALAEIPVLGAALSGTTSWTAGNNVITTTVNQTGSLNPGDYIVLAWNSIDGVGTGRQIQQVSSVTATTIVTQTNIFAPTSSGITAYHISSTPDIHGWTFLAWTQGNPATTWHYYDAPIGFHRFFYRNGNPQYQTWARAYEDIVWTWVLDHGYTYVYPRASSMISQFFRALDGHSERLPGLYLEASSLMTNFGQSVQFCPYCDNREAGYAIWNMALGAKTDTNSTRHSAYCSALTTYAPYWNTVQQPDGSYGENEYAINSGFVSAVKSFTPPFIYQGAPWRQAINVKSLEAVYESLSDTSSQGCNNPTLAATLLTTITNLITWQWNYGRDNVNRGVFYEVNSQSADQETIGGTGTVSISLGSNALTGVGTNFLSTIAAYPFIGIASPNNPRTVYKRASCSDDTHCLLTTNFGLFGETLNVSGSTYGLATPAKSPCPSLATYCYGITGDRNLERTVVDGVAWLYQHTLNPTYKTWADELLSAQLGGPTAGLTSASNIGAANLPCSGTACDGWVTDTATSAPNCSDTGNVPPCQYGGVMYSNLGKNYGEAFGALAIDNALARRLLQGAAPLTCAPASGLSTPNVKDIQLQTNMALGVSACTNNLKQSGNCNIIDIQRVTTAALGGACKVGP